MVCGYTDAMSDDTPDPKVLQSNTTKWLTATLVGIGSGVAGFVTKVHNEFYDNCRNLKEVQAKFTKHGEKLEELQEKYKANPTGDSYIKGVRDKKQTLAREIDEVTQKLGIESHGIAKYTTGSLQRFRTLSDNTRMPVVFGAVTAAFVGTAATLMFFNSMQTRHKLDTIHKNSTAER